MQSPNFFINGIIPKNLTCIRYPSFLIGSYHSSDHIFSKTDHAFPGSFFLADNLLGYLCK